MRAAIFSLLPVRRGSTIASIRIGYWLSIHLGVPLHDDQRILDEGDLDVLFIINGSTLYCKFLPELAQVISKARAVVWVQNDYTLPPPKAESAAQSPFRRAFAARKLVPHYWTTCEPAAAATAGSAYVNWNALAYAPGAPTATLDNPTTIYYGAYRVGRSDSFNSMVRMSSELNLKISSTSNKFPADLRIDPFRENLYTSLCDYGLGVYAQDRKSVTGGHSPATRFYEMLSVGLPIAFLPDCVETFKNYGYDVEPYLLTPDALHHRHQWAAQQRAWRADFPAQVRASVNAAWQKLIGTLT